ncbi:hypothetical protein ABI_21170 [Asticcacaulis biprosthecium C19]|uniref:Uncharacterized protein n=2 Tax=Asticcacaulis biprosthecium TaxID=76891 RepID=F4QGJ4_9CAUL|nr:hypothetical protein ABI_21170 [Asticcacaulis biprosthecium C19]
MAASGKDTVTDFSAAQNDTIDVNAYTHVVVNTGWVSQAGTHVVIILGGGTVITVPNASQADVVSHMT